MTTSNNPDEIRANIERTRANISGDVNALADEANPKNVARRQMDKVKDGAQNLKDRVFGTDDPYAPTAGDRVEDARMAVGEKVEDAKTAVRGAPGQVKRGTRGNPLAAGLIAFGVGALIGGLMPASEKEKQLAGKIKTEAQPLVEEVQAVAKEAAENLKGDAQVAAENVKEAATQASENVQGEAQAARDDVQAQAQASKETVQDSRN